MSKFNYNKRAVEKNWLAVPCLIFFVAIFFQMRMTYLYFDDYGYASLSYVVNVPGVKGTDFTLLELMIYLWKHYISWGGRILPFFVEIILLKIGKIWFQLAQAIIITALGIEYIRVLANKEKVNKEKCLLLILVFSMYGLLQIDIMRESAYWYSASILYLFPLLPLVYGVRKFAEEEKRGKENQIQWLECVCLFLSAASQEQVSVLTLVTVIGISIYKGFQMYRMKMWHLKNLFATWGFVLSGMVFLYIAPGNWQRAGDQTWNIRDIMVQNIPQVLNHMFGDSVLLLIGFEMIIFSVFLIVMRLKGKIPRVLTFIILILHLFFFVGSIYYHQSIWMWMTKRWSILSVSMILIIYEILVTILLGIYYLQKKKEREGCVIFFLHLGSLASMAVMGIIPAGIAFRTSLPYLLIQILVFTSLLWEIIQKQQSHDSEEMITKKNPRVRLVSSLVLLVLVGVIEISAGYNGATIFRGYQNNNQANHYNDQLLKRISKKCVAGEKVQKVTLYRMNDERYTALQPYVFRDIGKIIEKEMKEYYDLPESIEFEWIWSDKIP